MKRLIKYLKDWNYWRKHNANGVIHHLFVLFGVIASPSFGRTWEDYK